VPGKSEFNETLRYYRTQLNKYGVEIRCGIAAEAEQLIADGFDEVVVATGVSPRRPEIPGIDLPHVATYSQVFEKQVRIGERVVIIGAGGIACDLSHLLAHNSGVTSESSQYLLEYRILDPKTVHKLQQSGRKIAMLRRGKHVGTGLGKTTRWAVLALLKRQGVEMLTEIEYKAITPEGVTFLHKGEERFIPADTVVIAAGSTPNSGLADELRGRLPVHVIGGAKEAGELDAKRAILEGALAARTI
jgi:2,4-dienoyl-CoA reductase (NADPH2)